MVVSAWIQITRPVNCFFAAFAGILATIIATGTITPSVWYVFFIILLVTGAGNVINDYYDAEIDAINQPQRPIPSGKINRKSALCYAIILFLAGIILAYLSAPAALTGIAVINSIILWLYAAYLKSTPIFGNIAVSYLTSSIFIFGGAIQGISGIISLLPITGATFGVILARELVKDAEDMPGDKACGARTIPVLYGVQKTLILAMFCAIAGIIISLLLFQRWGIYYLIAIAIPDLIIFYGAIKGVRNTSAEQVINSKSSKILKTGMFLSLLIFLLSAVILG